MGRCESYKNYARCDREEGHVGSHCHTEVWEDLPLWVRRLDLTVRAQHVLVEAGVESLEQLKAMSDAELRAIHGVGKNIFREYQYIRTGSLRQWP